VLQLGAELIIVGPVGAVGEPASPLGVPGVVGAEAVGHEIEAIPAEHLRSVLLNRITRGGRPQIGSHRDDRDRPVEIGLDLPTRAGHALREVRPREAIPRYSLTLYQHGNVIVGSIARIRWITRLRADDTCSTRVGGDAHHANQPHHEPRQHDLVRHAPLLCFLIVHGCARAARSASYAGVARNECVRSGQNNMRPQRSNCAL